MWKISVHSILFCFPPLMDGIARARETVSVSVADSMVQWGEQLENVVAAHRPFDSSRPSLCACLSRGFSMDTGVYKCRPNLHAKPYALTAPYCSRLQAPGSIIITRACSSSSVQIKTPLSSNASVVATLLLITEPVVKQASKQAPPTARQLFL